LNKENIVGQIVNNESDWFNFHCRDIVKLNIC